MKKGTGDLGSFSDPTCLLVQNFCQSVQLRGSGDSARRSILPVINQLPMVKPMPLVERSEPFNHTDWIYEIKYDGFRALT